MIKSGLIGFFLCLCCQAVQAEKCPKLLMVWAKDGSRQAYALSQLPEVTFSGSTLVIKGENLEVSYPLADMARFTYEENDVTGITSLTTGEKLFELRDESLYFPSLPAQTQVRIYGVDGKAVLTQVVAQEGPYTFSLQHLQPGTYMVQVNGLTTKIMKR